MTVSTITASTARRHRACRARHRKDLAMRALFVGGTVDNSELDPAEAPQHYPTEAAGRAARYDLSEIGRREGEAVYAVYAAAGMPPDEVERIIVERQYPRRFNAERGAPSA
jgi:hypothetical protein